MRSMAGVVVAGVAMGLALGCSRAPTGGSARSLTVKGSDTLLHVSLKWAEEFGKKTGVKVSVDGGGSGTGIAALINGSCDIANASREIKSKEVDQARAVGKTVVETVVAKDGISVIVNNANPAKDLSLEQIMKVFTGTYTNWKQIDPSFDEEIVIYSRKSTSGTYGFFQEVALKKKEYRQDGKFVDSNSAIIVGVEQSGGGVGYVGLGYYEGAKGRVRAVTVDGVAPSVATVVDGRYPVARGLNVYTAGAPAGAAKRYIDFALSAEGQRIVAEQGFVPVR